MRSLVPGRTVLEAAAARRRAPGGKQAPDVEVGTDVPVEPPPGLPPVHLPPVHLPPAVPAPDYVLSRLAAWSLLHEVPFAYLVPDPDCLPPESIRFFHLDQRWVTALTDAALGLGTDAPLWSARRAQVGSVVRAAVRGRARLVRDVRRGRTVRPDAATPDGGPPRPVSGFLLRSSLVDGWRGMEVRAWTVSGVPLGVDPDVYAGRHPDHVVALLRLERLSPGVLLALFDGVPRLVWLEEPHQGVQLGVDAQFVPDVNRRESRPLIRYTVEVREPDGNATGERVDVPMRAGSVPGVIDVATLADRLDDVAPLDAPRGGAGMGLALLEPPARQRFASGGRGPS